MDLFHPFNLKIIAMKMGDTAKFLAAILRGKYNTSEELEAEIYRIRSKWGLPADNAH